MKSDRIILFDLDNTLYHYDPCDEAAVEDVAEYMRSYWPEVDVRSEHDRIRRIFAKRLANQAASHNRLLFFKHMVECHAGRTDAKLALALEKIYWRSFLRRIRPGPDTHSVLKDLISDSRIVLVTNQTASAQLRKVTKLRLDPYIELVITSEEAGVEKPDAGIYQLAMARMRIQPHQAVMVGDTADDVAGAAACGMRTVLSTEFTGAVPCDAVADRVIGSLKELPEVLVQFPRT